MRGHKNFDHQIGGHKILPGYFRKFMTSPIPKMAPNPNPQLIIGDLIYNLVLCAHPRTCWIWWCSPMMLRGISQNFVRGRRFFVPILVSTLGVSLYFNQSLRSLVFSSSTRGMASSNVYTDLPNGRKIPMLGLGTWQVSILNFAPSWRLNWSIDKLWSILAIKGGTLDSLSSPKSIM